MKKWIIGLGGVLLALGLAILGRSARQLHRTEKERDQRLATRIKADQDKAEKLAKKSEKHKEAAKIAAQETKRRLDEAGKQNDEMADLLDSWRAERVRQQSG